MRKNLFTLMLICSYLTVMAAETEPNNTWNNANALTNGVAETGTITIPTDVDWFRLRINQDGIITVSGGVTNTGCLSFQLFDTLGVIALNSSVLNCGSISTQQTDGLASGTYYLRITSTSSNVSYSFTLSLTAATLANDLESNNTSATAILQNLNSSNTGHIGYYFNNLRDSFDWYRVTTTGNGALRLSYTGNTGGCAYFQLFDNDGITALNNEVFNCGSTSIQITDGLAAGTYRVRIRITGNYFVTYTLANNFLSPPVANDTEPNNTRNTAKVITLNGSVSGHMGYRSNGGLRDSVDWWKITTTLAGDLQVSYTEQSGGCAYFQIFDNNATTPLSSEAFNCANTNATIASGLNPGTYYVRVRSYSTDFTSYTLKDTLILPPVGTEPEPNNLAGQAVTLPLNGSLNGQMGYYYNGLKDSIDWWKITTTLAGNLQVFYTEQSGGCAYFQIFDNNAATTLSNEAFNCANTNATIASGLNPGTYYVRVRRYSTDFTTYTLKDTLILPPVAADPEPNNQPVQAAVKLVNSTVTGLVGYYYNNERDTADWWKVTLPSSGGLQLQFTGVAGNCAYYQLFDTVVNGVLTPRNSEVFNCGATNSQNTDGLGAGTYYIRVRPGDLNGQIFSYSLKDSLITLPPDNDNLPNDQPYQSATLPSNDTVTGNIGYSYNNMRDMADWAKINYTGTGNMTVQFTSQPRAFAVPACIYLRIYADTNAAPIGTLFNCGNTNSINLSGLSQQYYYLKVETNNPSVDFAQYSVANFFSESNKASITLVSSTQPTDCNPTGVLRVQCSGSKAPYTLRLFRFGVLDRVVKINNNAPVNITGLPNGIWNGRVYGDGASDTAFGLLQTATLMPVPTGLNVTNIQATQVRLNFSNFNPCIDGYGIQYRKQGDVAWILDTARQSPFTLKGLMPSTTYQWRVASGDTANSLTAVSQFSTISSFTTLANQAEAAISNLSAGKLLVWPNPSNNYFKVQYNGMQKESLYASLYDITGAVRWSSWLTAAQLTGSQIDVSHLPPGHYRLVLSDASGQQISSEKVIVQR